MFQILEEIELSARIKVIGVGGGGGNAVEHMLTSKVEGVEFLSANTDAQALQRMSGSTLLHMGTALTKGLGAGADPEVGRLAAHENREMIREHLLGADLVFITAGMGGGTGTGAAPIIAQIARELGALTVAVVTRPFKFEGKKRTVIAEAGIEALRDAVDSLIILPNDKLVPVLGRKTSLLDAFGQANNVLKGAVQGIADLITRPGMINVDFADVRTVMASMGMGMMGTGIARGESRAAMAAEQAINSPLLEEIDLKGARGLLVNIAAGEDLSLGEFSEVGEIIGQYAADDATIVIGTAIDPSLGDDIKVTLVATGLDRSKSAPLATNESWTQDLTQSLDVPVLVSNTRQTTDRELDLTRLELPEILTRDRREALLDRSANHATAQNFGQKTQFDLSELDIPTYARR